MATIGEIAKKAGVSVALVSKALNDYPDVNKETKKKILELASEMGYFPNSSARRLAKSKSDKIGIIIRANTESRFIDEINMIYAFSTFDRAHKLGMEITLVFSNIFEEKTDNEISNYLKSEGITGLIIFGLSLEKDDKMMSLFKDDFFKKVLIDIPITNTTTSSVTIDNIEAQYQLLKKCIVLNKHQNICYLSGPETDITSEERRKGMIKFQIETNCNVEYFVGEYRDDIAFEIVKKNPNFNAYICANDMMAIGVNNYFKRKKSNPLITGFDNIKLITYLELNIPTIEQDFHLKSKIAVDSLVNLFQGEKSELKIVDYKLISNNKK